MTIDLKAGIVRVLKPNGETSGTAFAVTDVTILHLDGPVPEAVIPLSLGSSAGVEGHALSTLGFPNPKPVEGMAGKCEVVGRTTEKGFPVLQLRLEAERRGAEGISDQEIAAQLGLEW
jgi:hypothetical protein